jgi:hypothetical protein
MMVYMAISIHYAITIVRLRVPTSEGILIDATRCQIGASGQTHSSQVVTS